MVSCEEPYIGEELIMRPPPAKKARITSAQASRASGSLPTLKVRQLPSPTSGSRSPDDGIGRVSSGAPAACARRGKAAPMPAAASDVSNWRRSSIETSKLQTQT